MDIVTIVMIGAFAFSAITNIVLMGVLTNTFKAYTDSTEKRISEILNWAMEDEPPEGYVKDVENIAAYLEKVSHNQQIINEQINTWTAHFEKSSEFLEKLTDKTVQELSDVANELDDIQEELVESINSYKEYEESSDIPESSIPKGVISAGGNVQVSHDDEGRPVIEKTEAPKNTGAVQPAKPFTLNEYNTILDLYTHYYDMKEQGEKGYNQEALAKELNEKLGRQHGIKHYRKVWTGKIKKPTA